METCPYCNQSLKSITSRHKAICKGWPKAAPPEPCLCGHESTSLTQMKRHRQKCTAWAARDKKAVARSRMVATSLARYGVADASQAPEVLARREATNLERYGAANPFSKEATTFEKVQESLVGKRPVLQGADNPFAKPDVQEKIRATMTERYGAANPQQVLEVRARTKATVIERYGGELLASPILRAKAEATNFERYGAAFAGGTPEVRERVKATNMARYGVPHTCMDPDVRRRQVETMEANYGGHFFASDEGKRIVRAALKEGYGVEFPGAIPGHWNKVLVTFKEHYPDLEWPGMLARSAVGPNGLEQDILSLAPTGSLLYMGDGKFWRHLPKLGHHKNADFIVPGPDPEHPMRGVTKVVEAFGDFWHSRMFTGKAPFDHESELVEAYAEVGIECLIVWESEVRSDHERVRERLVAFLCADQTAPDVLDLFG